MQISKRRLPLRHIRYAIRGDEARLLKRSDVIDFYASTYLIQNPSMDRSDVPTKSERLLEILDAAGIHNAVSILEIGAGSGELLGLMARALGAQQSIAADVSLNIAIEANRHPYIIADAAASPFRRGAVHVAYFADVLEHLESPGRTLLELGRIARAVAFIIPLEAGFLSTGVYVWRRLRGASTSFSQYGHIWRWTRRRAIRELRRAGLSTLAVKVIESAPPVTASTTRGRALQRFHRTLSRIAPTLSVALFGGTLLGVARSEGQ